MIRLFVTFGHGRPSGAIPSPFQCTFSNTLQLLHRLAFPHEPLVWARSTAPLSAPSRDFCREGASNIVHERLGSRCEASSVTTYELRVPTNKWRINPSCRPRTPERCRIHKPVPAARIPFSGRGRERPRLASSTEIPHRNRCRRI